MWIATQIWILIHISRLRNTGQYILDTHDHDKQFPSKRQSYPIETRRN